MRSIDLNADVGEGGGNDAAILEFVTSANIACGVHAGGPEVMARTIALASTKSVAVGAHPGFADRAGFGRRAVPATPREVHDLVVSQVNALWDFARAAGVRMQHVKPHGALYNMAASDAALADAIASALAVLDRGLILFGLAGSELIAAGERAGLRTAAEGFADRTYTATGTLTPRSQPGALIEDEGAAVAQAISLATEGKVRAGDGSDVEVEVDTICIHGDSPQAPAVARAIRAGLEAEGITVKPLGS